VTELEVPADDVVGRNESFQRRVHDEPRGGRDDVEVESEAVDAVLQKVGEQRDVTLETNLPADLDQILLTHAPEIGIVSQQVGQLRTRLHEIQARKVGDSFLEIGNAEHLGEHMSRVVE